MQKNKNFKKPIMQEKGINKSSEDCASFSNKQGIEILVIGVDCFSKTILN